MKKYLLYLSLPLYLLDQLTKLLIVRHFPDETFHGEEIVVIPGFFNLVRVHNTGMAFGQFNNSQYANLAFGTIAITALVAIVMLWKRNAFPTLTARVSAALLISGILGNLTDRLMPGRGYVVDFLDFYIGSRHWPSFNVADSCITIAACLLVISAFRPDDPSEIDNE